MSYWLFVASQANGLDPDPKWTFRSKDGFWGLKEKTPNRYQIKTGDGVIFYLGKPAYRLVGPAILTSEFKSLTDPEIEKLAHGRPELESPFGVYFKPLLDSGDYGDCDFHSLLPRLILFKDHQERWWDLLLPGVVALPEQDFDLITSNIEVTPNSYVGMFS